MVNILITYQPYHNRSLETPFVLKKDICIPRYMYGFWKLLILYDFSNIKETFPLIIGTKIYSLFSKRTVGLTT